MWRLLLFLVASCAAWTSASSAWALPRDTMFEVVLTDGPDPADGTPVGKLYVQLADEVRGACRYYGDWDDAAGGAFEVGCWLNERKTHLHTSCFTNSRDAFATLVTMESRYPCWGFDRHARPQQLFMLAGAERADPVGLHGLIQWTAATPVISAFEARMQP
jgi:hypothetical protein